MRAHLDDEGLFAFETRNPHWAGLENRTEAEAGQAVTNRQRRGHFFDLETRAEAEDGPTYTDSSGHDVRVSMTQSYDPVAQILHLTGYRRWVEANQEQTKITRIALRYTFPQELEALLYYNGFTIIRQYGDWNLEPLTAAARASLSSAVSMHSGMRS